MICILLVIICLIQRYSPSPTGSNICMVQSACGIDPAQTIALVAVEGGLLQLGSTLKVRDSIFYGSGSSGFCPSDAWKSRFSRQE
jgi:hypothetical protein